MELPAQTDHNGESSYDLRVSQAIDRVLEAERLAQAAVASCETQGRESVERARQRRRIILERAQQRIVALHTRAARTIERRVAQVNEQHGKAVAGGMAQDADHARLQAAIETLADRLIGLGNEEA